MTADKLLKITPPMNLLFAFNIEKETLNYCSEEIFELVPSTSEVRGNWKWRTEEVEEIVVHLEDGAMPALSTPFLKCKLYTHYTHSVGSADQCLCEIVQYEASRHEWSGLFPTSE